MTAFITLTNDDGDAVHFRADRVDSVTARPARSADKLDKLIAAHEARLNLVEGGFEVDNDSFCCGPRPEQIRKDLARLTHERDTGVAGSVVKGGDHCYVEVREPDDNVVEVIDAILEGSTP